MASMISGGSAIRPAPTWPQLNQPVPGSTNETPSARNCVTLRCTEDLAHISQFIAGARSSGQVAVSVNVDNRSRANPPATSARKLAVAGATTISSAR